MKILSLSLPKRFPTPAIDGNAVRLTENLTLPNVIGSDLESLRKGHCSNRQSFNVTKTISILIGKKNALQFKGN